VSKLEIKIKIPSLKKSVTLQVEADHTIRSIIGTVCEGVGLKDPSTWIMIHRGNEISSSKKIGDTDIREDETLDLIGTGSRLVIEEYSTQNFPRRNFLKYGVTSIGALAIIGAAAYYGTKPPVSTQSMVPQITHNPNDTWTPPTQPPTYTPTPTEEPFDFDISVRDSEYNISILDQERNSLDYYYWYSDVLVSLLHGVPEKVHLSIRHLRPEFTADFSLTSGTPTFNSELTITWSKSHYLNINAELRASGGGKTKSAKLFVGMPI